MSGRTLVLTHLPCGDLLSEAVLREGAGLFARGERPLLAAPPFAARRAAAMGYEQVPPEAEFPDIARVVLLGPFVAMPALEAALARAARVVAAGGELLVHNLTLEGNCIRTAAPPGAAVLDRARSVTVRDHRTANTLTVWRIARGVPVLGFPERRIPTDPALEELLPGGPVLGVCVRGAADVRKVWAAHREALRAALAAYEGWAVLPLPMGPPATSGDADDAIGSRDFAAAIWPRARIALAGMLDRAWYQSKLSPARYKGLVGMCEAVVTQRDLPAAFAIEAGVPVQALMLGPDRRAMTCLATLANQLPAGSAAHAFTLA